MKPEVYQCLKMLESFKKSCVEAAIKETHIAAWGLLTQYNMIKGRLADCLEKEQLRCIPDVEMGSYRDTLLELSSASGIAIAFLRSLDSSPEKELEAREQDLARGQKEVESMKKLLKESLEAVKEIPEVLRSKAVAEWKTSHREIEGQSRPRGPDGAKPSEQQVSAVTIDQLKVQLRQIPRLRKFHAPLQGKDNAQFVHWRTKTSELLWQALPSDSVHAENFDDIDFEPKGFLGLPIPITEPAEAYTKGLDEAEAVLKTVIEVVLASPNDGKAPR